MHLSALLSLVALPFLANGRPTSQELPVHIMPGGDNIAGIFANGPEFNGIFVNGGCSPNFGKTVKLVLIFEGYRCRFFRYVAMLYHSIIIKHKARSWRTAR